MRSKFLIFGVAPHMYLHFWVESVKVTELQILPSTMVHNRSLRVIYSILCLHQFAFGDIRAIFGNNIFIDLQYLTSKGYGFLK